MKKSTLMFYAGRHLNVIKLTNDLSKEKNRRADKSAIC